MKPLELPSYKSFPTWPLFLHLLVLKTKWVAFLAHHKHIWPVFLIFSLIEVSGGPVWNYYFCLVSLCGFGLEVKQAFHRADRWCDPHDTASVWLGSWGQAEPCDCRIFKGPEGSSPLPRGSMFLLQVDKNNDVSFFVTRLYVKYHIF